MKKFLLSTLAVLLLCAGAVGAQDIFGYSTMRAVYLVNSFIDSTPIGSHSASTGIFTNLTASALLGPLTGNVIGNLTGNASTASALAAAPSNCTSTGFAYGVGANGNALCNSATIMQGMAIHVTAGVAGICTTATGAYQVCNNTYNYSPTGVSSGAITWPVTPSVVCSPGTPQGTSALMGGGFYVSNVSTTSFETTIINGGTSGAEGATTTNDIYCIVGHN